MYFINYRILLKHSRSAFEGLHLRALRYWGKFDLRIEEALEHDT